ncbi:MAG: hypothetical protein MUF74_09995 [Cypionkella sp.]|nr:hypothetical protein [Cypionkella sp.]
MSNPESVLLVLGVVGGTAWTEWSKARAAADAEAFGDALRDALDLGGPEDRREALASIPANPSQRAVLDLILATDPQENRDETLAALARLEADTRQPQSWRDLATLRRITVAGAELPVAERRAALDALAAPGRPFRPLALEQMAYLDIEEGQTEAALARLEALTQDQEAPAPLRSRAGQMIMVLGGEAPVPAAVPDVPAGEDGDEG